MRPRFITNEDILRWQTEIDSDHVIKERFTTPETVELYYAASYLAEQLEELICPQSLILRIIYSAAKASYGKDPWDVHIEFLESYKIGKLDFEIDSTNLN